MSILSIYPSNLCGVLKVPSSKSLTHRAIIAASLSEGVSILEGVNFSADVLETLSAVRVLGVEFEVSDGKLKIFGGLRQSVLNQNCKEIKIKCFESASTVRFLIPVVAALGFKVKFVVGARLFERISESGFDGLFFFEVGDCCFRVNKILEPGCFCFKKCLTSQFITGLFLALPVFKKSSLIIFENTLESYGFVKLTISFLKQLGIKIKKLKNGFIIPANQVYKSFKYKIEGDFSLASFFAVAGCFDKIRLSGLNYNSVQSDLLIVEILRFCGADVEFEGSDLIVQPGVENLKCFEIDLTDSIDLAPILSVLASFCSGVSKLFGVARLKFKESNRIFSILNLINGLGGRADFFGGCLKIKGIRNFSGGVVDCFNDHRIAMAAAITSCASKDNVVLVGADCVSKSWPGFFDSFRKLGGVLSGFNLE